MDNLQSDFATEPIAIIGLSCKFAGDARSPEDFWRLLAEGRDAWTEIPSSRFNWKGVYHPSPEKSGAMNVKGGYFLEEDIGLFDTTFFGFSTETAASERIPPSSIVACADASRTIPAGLPLTKLAGSNTSVFAGAFNHDYREGMVRDEDNIPRLMITGTGAAMASNRISHFFDLRGASMTIDTGCSTSMVALHQSVQSLRGSESEMAIVTCSNIMLNPDMFKALGSIRVLSPDGKSYSFDSRANGYGRGEGTATVVLKRLRDAVTQGDPIRAIIRETAINQDGKTETITTPSMSAQVDLMRECYRKAGLDPSDTQYFEAHGTGTPTGDPIEMQAVASVFNARQSSDNPILMGGVKSNIGHTEPVSGLASLIKTVLSLERGLVPPAINFESPNPKIRLDEWHIQIPRNLTVWPSVAHGVRRASINNFGYGGTNVHVIVEAKDSWMTRFNPQSRISNGIQNGNLNGNHRSAPGGQVFQVNGDANTTSNGTISHTRPWRNKTKVFVLSAKDEQTCRQMVSTLKSYLQQNHPVDIENYLQSLAYTLGERRTLFPWVAAGSVSYVKGIEEFVKNLGSLELKATKITRSPRIGMVFTGQGAQWHAMGRELMIAYPTFKQSLVEADGYLRELGTQWSLLDELSHDEESSRVNHTGLSIPICVALQISLVRLLRDWGITPKAVTSHSSGEIAAAFTVGAISYQGAMAIAYYRSVLAADDSLRGSLRGGMIALGIGEEEARAHLETLKSRSVAVVACVNSQSSVTVAGDIDAIEELETNAKEDGVFARRLKVDTAYHSHHMEPIAGPYLKALSNINLRGNVPTGSSPITFSSPVTGGRIDNLAELGGPEHWVASLLRPVQFLDAFSGMVQNAADPAGLHVDVVIEVGPHSALRGPIRQILELPEFDGVKLPYYSCLERKIDARDSMQALAASLFSEGQSLNLEALNFPYGKDSNIIRVLTDLPSYPWNHKVRHWSEPRFNRALRERADMPHDLLGSLILGANPEAPSWRHIIRTSDAPWLRDHVVQNSILFPAAGFMSLAIEAIAHAPHTTTSHVQSASTQIAGIRLQDVDVMQALVVPDDAAGIEIQIQLRSADEKIIGLKDWKHFDIYSVTADNQWTQHAKGKISVEFEDPSAVPTLRDIDEWSITGPTRRIDPDAVFATLGSVGIKHGPVFRNIKSIIQASTQRQSQSVFTVADTGSTSDAPCHPLVHPTTLDSVIQAAYTALPEIVSRQKVARVPRAVKSLWVSSNISSQHGHTFRAHSVVNAAESEHFQADITVFNDAVGNHTTAEPLLEVSGLTCQSLGHVMPLEQTKPWEKCLANKVEWATDLTLMSPAKLGSLAKDLGYDVDPKEIGPIDLRPVCIYFIQDALAALSQEDVDRLEPHHVKYHKWMGEQLELAASSSLGPDSRAWLYHSRSERQRRIKAVAGANVTGEMICHLGPHIGSMVRREKSPLELMMHDKLLYRYYEDGPKLKRCYVQAGSLLQQIVHKNPRARILEIGAGTGSVTRYALKALGTADSGGPLAASYHYTDVSKGFFDTAREEFASWAEILSFEKLDIEQDPLVQGFEPESFDVVIACEVLHATRSMHNTMTNVRSLMKPGGTLLLIETTQDQVDLHFVFGLLPGWWLSEEPERASGPTVTLPLWERYLKETGFTGVDLSIPDCESDDSHSFRTIMSRASPSSPSTLAPEELIIVTTGEAPLPTAWQEALRKRFNADETQLVIHKLGTAAPETYNGKLCVFIGEVEQPVLHEIDAETFKNVKALCTACKCLLWVTRGGSVGCEQPELALATGFLRSLRNEYVGRRFVQLDLDPSTPAWSDRSISAISDVLLACFVSSSHVTYLTDLPPDENEYAERDGTILLPRYYADVVRNDFIAADKSDTFDPTKAQMEPLQQPHRYLAIQVGVRGLLDTLAFGDDPRVDLHSDILPPDYVEIEPRAYGLNFRDVMVALGQIDDDTMGIECAGIIARVGDEAGLNGHKVGDHVCCILRGTFGSRARIEWWNVVPIPARLTFEQAASLPMIFGTAYYSLVELARLEAGQSVLIHAAAGGVGQAAIMIAMNIGAEIFATVSSPQKRGLLIEKYGIPEDHIFNSRNDSFVSALKQATSSRGVDVVLNSLAGPLLQQSFDALSPFGHFIELGRRDFELNSALGMKNFIGHVSFSSVDMLALSRHKGYIVHRVLREIMRQFEDNLLSPVESVTVYPIGEISKAFRMLQSGNHTGKVVLSTGEGAMVPTLPPVKSASFSPEASYLMVGGLGGIGRSIAAWFASRGAKNLIVLSRNAGSSLQTEEFVAELQELNCRVHAVDCDVANEKDLSKALTDSANLGLPPVRGVIQAAMVLKDSIIEQMTLNDFQAAIRPKVNATWNLHKQFEKVDFFVMLSSINGIVGYASQSNYSAGGSYQDALARWRVARGYPAVSLDLSAIESVGYVAETEGVAERMRRAGHLLLNEDQLIGVIESAILEPYQPQVVVGLNAGPGPQWDREGESQLGRDARFTALRHHTTKHHLTGPASNKKQNSLGNRLSNVTSPEEAQQLICDAISQKLSDIFMLSVDDIDPSLHPSRFGVDSLVAVELRNMLAQEAAAEISIFGILQSPSLTALAAEVASKSRYVSSDV
ncbi:beta-ketoacyl synthase domain-containing protein [Seiridium cupressi]